MKCWSLVLGLLLCSGAAAQKPSRALQGSWTATAGPNQVFRGTWTAQASSEEPNVARGSWTLLSDTDEILLTGTWSARKSGQGWQGTWTARTIEGRSLSGVWSADMADSGSKTFKDMLERTAAKEVAGPWRTGRYQGEWWLRGYRPQGRTN